MLKIENNGIGNQIPPVAIGRKNWLFNNNAKGAKAASVIYSLVATGKASGLDQFLYLMWR
jgi:hypothetical protein